MYMQPVCEVLQVAVPAVLHGQFLFMQPRNLAKQKVNAQVNNDRTVCSAVTSALPSKTYSGPGYWLCIFDILLNLIAARAHCILLPTGHAQYITLTTASGHRLQLSSSHYAYTAPSAESTWAQRVAVEGKAVRPGHVLWVVDIDSSSLVQSEVMAVEVRTEAGAFVIWTLQGHAVVDGTAPSSYSSSFGSEQAMNKVSGLL